MYCPLQLIASLSLMLLLVVNAIRLSSFHVLYSLLLSATWHYFIFLVSYLQKYRFISLSKISHLALLLYSSFTIWFPVSLIVSIYSAPFQVHTKTRHVLLGSIFYLFGAFSAHLFSSLFAARTYIFIHVIFIVDLYRDSGNGRIIQEVILKNRSSKIHKKET